MTTPQELLAMCERIISQTDKGYWEQHDVASIARALKSRLAVEAVTVDAIARVMWESEPEIYAWGPQERHGVSWHEAVMRGLAGVVIFRKFASAIMAILPGEDTRDAVIEECAVLCDSHADAFESLGISAREKCPGSGLHHTLPKQGEPYRNMAFKIRGLQSPP